MYSEKIELKDPLPIVENSNLLRVVNVYQTGSLNNLATCPEILQPNPNRVRADIIPRPGVGVVLWFGSSGETLSEDKMFVLGDKPYTDFCQDGVPFKIGYQSSYGVAGRVTVVEYIKQ